MTNSTVCGTAIGSTQKNWALNRGHDETRIFMRNIPIYTLTSILCTIDYIPDDILPANTTYIDIA